MVLFSSPVTKTTEEVVGQKPVDGIPDDVNVDRLLYPEPVGKKFIISV